MSKVVVMTDTVSYLPEHLADEYKIKVVPLNMIVEGRNFIENEVDLPYYYDNFPKWKDGNILPTTSGVSLGTFIDAYRELGKIYEAIVYIGHCHRLGMTVQIGEQAKQQIKREMPDISIEVIDSLTACGSQALIVLEAARAARDGKRFQEVINIANSTAEKVNHIGLFDDLYYLLKGGRIQRARPWASSKISNTALIEMDRSTDGEIRPVNRCKTKGQALNALFDLVRERGGGGKLHVFINHGNVPAEAEELKAKVMSDFSCSEVYITEIGPVVTIHVGMGVRLFQWWSED